MKTEGLQLKIFSKEIKSNDFVFFKSEITAIIQELDQRGDTDLKPTEPGQVFIDESGIKLLAPKARLGKHARVYILHIEKDGKRLNCVLRNQVVDAENYIKAIDKKPAIRKFLPELYGVANGWVIMEELSGLELGEVEEKLITDEAFRQRFARSCSDAVYILSSNDVTLNDINFTNGHNIKVQEDGSFKFIEQAALEPEAKKALGFNEDEVLSERIFTHLENWKINDMSNPDRTEALRDFEFQFMYNLINKVSPEKLMVKYRYLLPSHEYYRSSFNSYTDNKDFWVNREFQELKEGEYEKLDKPTLPWAGNGYSAGKKLNPEFISAIKNHDVEKFLEMVNKKEAVTRLEYSNDNIVTLS